MVIDCPDCGGELYDLNHRWVARDDVVKCARCRKIYVPQDLE